MLRFTILSFLLVLILSCRQHVSTEYYWIRLRGHEYERIDTIKISKFASFQNGDTTNLSYTSKYGNLIYFIVANKDSSFTKSDPKEAEDLTDGLHYLHQILDTSIIIANSTFKIKKYIQDEFVTDGASIHYYEPTVGMYTVHSNTWTSLRYLQTSDSAINNKILRLIKATVPDFFIRGNLATQIK